jgi:hypothetical protein
MPTIFLVNVTQTNLKVDNNIKENIVRNIENLCLDDVFKLFQSLRVVRIDSLEQLEDIIQTEIFNIPNNVLFDVIDNFQVRLRHIHQENG